MGLIDQLKNLRDKLVKSNENVEKSRQERLERVGQNMSVMLVDQWGTGISEDGTPYSDYTTAYAKQLEKRGRPTDKKRFNDHGNLYASLYSEVVSADVGNLVVSVRVRGEENQNKVKGQFSKDGDIMQLSPDRIKDIIDAYKEDLQNEMEI